MEKRELRFLADLHFNYRPGTKILTGIFILDVSNGRCLKRLS